jgi:hypothetical protein
MFAARVVRVGGFVALAAAAMGAPGCAGSQHADDPAAEKSALTPGMVKLKIVKGQTTQGQILETFGPPDLVTHKDGVETWTYDKTSYDYEKRSDYLTVLFAGAGGDRVRSSSRSTMLIVYFDQAERVSDYRLSAVKY